MLLSCRESGVGYLDLTQPQDTSPLYANLVKSDGSTLYLTRHVDGVLNNDVEFYGLKLESDK